MELHWKCIIFLEDPKRLKVNKTCMSLVNQAGIVIEVSMVQRGKLLDEYWSHVPV